MKQCANYIVESKQHDHAIESVNNNLEANDLIAERQKFLRTMNACRL